MILQPQFFRRLYERANTMRAVTAEFDGNTQAAAR